MKWAIRGIIILVVILTALYSVKPCKTYKEVTHAGTFLPPVCADR